MKKLLLIAGLLAGSVMFANAQILAKSANQRVGHQMKALTKNLNLDATQSEKINTILMARATKVDSLKANNTGDKKANRQTIKALMQSTEEQVNAVLTTDQQKAYAQFKESRKGKMKRNGDQTMDTPPATKS